MRVDWLDVALHIGAAALFVTMFSVLVMARHEPGMVWVIMAANTAFWPGREAMQRRAKGHLDWWNFSCHKRLEAYPPVIVGWLIGGLILAV